MEVSRRLELSKSTVSSHISVMLAEGYILAIPGTKRPTFYKRGPRSNLLDEVYVRSDVRFDGGTVNGLQNSRTSEQPLTAPKSRPEEHDILTARAHINGRVVFDVLKQGEHEYIEVGETKTRFPLFPEKPYFNNHGCAKWKTRLPYDGYKVSMEYQETAKTKKLFVWPPELELVPEQFDDAEAMMITRAQEAVNLLQKYGGWRFGLVQFFGDIEYASSDARILSQISDDIKRPSGSECWVDSSLGTPEFETKGADKANIVFNFPKVVNELRDNQRSTIQEVCILHTTVRELAAIMEKIVEMKAKDTSAEVEQLVKQLAKATGGTSMAESGAMYR